MFPSKPAAAPVVLSRKKNLTPEKQAELDSLFEQLLQKKELIVSGKLQLIGLSKIKSRLGRRWLSLSKIVYQTIEDVLHEYTDNSDLSIRYREEVYIILFARLPKEEAIEKTRIIANEIRKRLFALDEDELRKMEIYNAVGVIKGELLGDQNISDFLDSYTADFEGFKLPLDFDNAEIESPTEPPLSAESIDVAADDYRSGNKMQYAKQDITLAYSYQPLWEVKRNAITTYLCETKDAATQRTLFNAYNSAHDVDALHHLSVDIDILKHAIKELESMRAQNRKVLITCPVQYNTLHQFDSYETYKQEMEKIPQELRQYLIFHVVDTDENLPIKDTYWFAKPLRQYCRHVFAEAPLRRDINFKFLHNTGIDVAGIRLRNDIAMEEQEIIKLINNFSTRAKSFNIPLVFVLGVRSLSVATSAVCAGFDFIGGPAICGKVDQPDAIQQYNHGNLLNQIINKP